MKHLMIFSLVVGSVLGTACRPGPVRTADMGPLPTAEEVMAMVRANSGERRSLRTEGRVTYFGDQGRVRLRAILLAQRPASFRVETVSPMEQPVDVMACNGEGLWLLSKDRLYEGFATADNIARLLPLRMEAPSVVDTLLGGLPQPDRFRATGIDVDSEGRWRIELDGAREGRGQLIVDPVRKVVRSMRLLNAAGKPRVQVDFDDFETLDAGGTFPRSIQIQIAAPETEVKIKLRAPEVDVPIAQELFTIEAPPGISVEQMSAG